MLLHRIRFHVSMFILLLCQGAKWHSRRKLLNPTFHFDILKQFVEILIDEGENITTSLKNEGDTVVKNLMPFFSEHTLNILCESVMGTSLQKFGEFKQAYIKAVHRMNILLTHRVIWSILNIDWIFFLTSKGREQKKILKILHGFTEQIIAERKLYHDQTNGRYLQSFDDDTSTISEDISAKSRGIRRKRLAMLDLLIKASRDGLMTDLDIREEVDTFMFEDRVRNEVNNALQENGEKFTMKLLQDLSYLERCIKESLRLYPSVYGLSRITEEDVKLQSYLVPIGTLLYVHIYGIHTDPNFWENPEVFDPDRFLPEKIRNRHPYSYIPFSAGLRIYIGHRFVMLEMKALIAALLRDFYLEPVNDVKTPRIQPDLIFRPAVPLYVKFIRIRKTNTNL